jgi:hypothetical protein
MFQLSLVYVAMVDREREIEAAIRRRHLLRPREGATEPLESTVRRTADRPSLAIRARTTGG